MNNDEIKLKDILLEILHSLKVQEILLTQLCGEIKDDFAKEEPKPESEYL